MLTRKGIQDIAEDTEGRWYGSAAQVIARDVDGLYTELSWCYDDYTAQGIRAEIETRTADLLECIG